MCKFCRKAQELEKDESPPKIHHYINRVIALMVIGYLVFEIIK